LSELKIYQFTCREDNFGVLLHHEPTSQTISIDAPDGGAIQKALDQHGWRLTHILVTHHHADHVEGVAGLKAKYGCKVIGPANPAIADLDQTVAEGDTLQLAGDSVNVIATPGHTLDMLNYHFAKAGVVFTGDTLFAMGCGRVFEGTPAQMWDSLRKLMALPKDTQVYCGHEYTLANARFSLTVDPQNPALQARAKEVEALRAQGKPTLPTTIALELATNPFLRAADPAIRKHLGMENATDAEVFTEIRERKNRG
jgi:hydroxyacylglutathione hydrolase